MRAGSSSCRTPSAAAGQRRGWRYYYSWLLDQTFATDCSFQAGRGAGCVLRAGTTVVKRSRRMTDARVVKAAMVSGIRELLTRGVIDAGREMVAALFHFDVGRR